VGAYRTRVVLSLACLSLAASGCVSSAAVQARIAAIRERHGVVVSAPNPLSRCYLFGNLPGLLDRIDEDLDALPLYFKQHIGPVIIEESFADNAVTYPLPGLVRGYVDSHEAALHYPIHIKNRSVLEKVLLFAPRDGDLFLHEATHSFEMNMRARERGRWVAFLREFRSAQPGRKAESYSQWTALGCTLALSLAPPLAYVRPKGMPSLYALMGHYEDVAETNCYLRRHAAELGALRTSDPVLLAKCRAVERFTAGEALPMGDQ